MDGKGPEPMAARLRTLHDVSMELARADDEEALLLRAVELCVGKLGFDRAGLWLYDPGDPTVIVGSWGTDESGKVRDERGIRLPRLTYNEPPELSDGSVPSVIAPEDLLYDDRHRPVGRSDKAIALLWDGSRALGELVADNLLSRRPIGEEDAELLVLIARTVAHLLALKRVEAELREALAAKALLLDELKHRTINSFALMRSLISFEANRSSDPAQAEALRRLRDRASVMSSLYRHLDTEGGAGSVRLGPYLERIARELLRASGAEARGVSLETRTLAVEIASRRAVTLGLVVNELLTDSLKHAFPDGRRGTVTLALAAEAGRCVLSISDDGVGSPAGPGREEGAAGPDRPDRPDRLDRPDRPAPEAGGGKGIGLIETLCRQLGAELVLRPGPGYAIELRFRLADS
jgi:two-component sensor histidine kinase